MIEAKSAGDFTNVNKRRKEEANKVANLRRRYGSQVRFVLFLRGYFDSGYLGYEAAEGIDWFFRHYIDDTQRDDWRFAPLNATDVDGVAPAWVGLAECDPLVDEGVAYADKLRLAGVPVQLELWRGMTHDFIKMGRAIPQALEAQASAAQALKERLFP